MVWWLIFLVVAIADRHLSLRASARAYCWYVWISAPRAREMIRRTQTTVAHVRAVRSMHVILWVCESIPLESMVLFGLLKSLTLTESGLLT